MAGRKASQRLRFSTAVPARWAKPAVIDHAGTTGPFRLIGVGISDLAPEDQADLSADLLDPKAIRQAAAERATDAIRAKFGTDAIIEGRALR